MLEAIIEDSITADRANNQPIFRVDIDYDELVQTRQNLIDRWGNLNTLEREKFTNLADFLIQEKSPNLKDESLIPAKNYSLMRREVQGRIGMHNAIKLLPIDSLDFDESVLELAENLEHAPDIREIYKLRKVTTGHSKNAGINAEEAARLKNCFTQGRELYLAGKQGSLMVKPLNFFYALTAYTYGAIVLNNPIRYNKGNIPGSHGMTYLPDKIQAQFGGDSPRGTFSDLVTSFPAQLIKTPSIEFNIDCSNSVLEFYENRFHVSLGTLLSTIPEMSEYYQLTTSRRSRCYPISVTNGNDPRTLTWDFHIGNGETRPDPESIDRSFPGFSKAERFGKIVVSVPASLASDMKACIYTDIRGSIWYIDNPFYPVILPEIATHFLITSIFSNIMRYRPDEWGSVLQNEVSSGISLITRHYFSSLQRKFFLIVLRSISGHIPYAV